MRQPLREKLQNAINRAILPENEMGALIVGGRRRSRKKKAKTKTNVNKNKKNAKKAEVKNKKYTVPNNREDSGNESEPLIEEVEEEDLKSSEDWGQEADDTENLVQEENEKMPFGFLKKSKKDKKDKKDKKNKNEKAENAANAANEEKENQQTTENQEESIEIEPGVFKEGTTLAAMAKTVPKISLRKDSDDDVSDGGFAPARYMPKPPPLKEKDENQTDAQEKTDPEKAVDGDQTDMKQFDVKDPSVKSENSPLIGKDEKQKDSKLQDQQPGMLCCTIL